MQNILASVSTTQCSSVHMNPEIGCPSIQSRIDYMKSSEYDDYHWNHQRNFTRINFLLLIHSRTQKTRKRKAKPITSASEPYQKIKMERLPSSEENSLLSLPSLPNEWNAAPPIKIKNEEIEIGETKLQPITVPAVAPERENSPTKLPLHIRVTEPILRDYGPSLMYIHALWTKNSKPLNIRRVAANPMCWTVDEVVDYVSRLPNCSKVARLFREHEIDGESFLSLCQNDLTDVLELRMGPAVKIYNQIVSLRSDVCENFMESE